MKPIGKNDAWVLHLNIRSLSNHFNELVSLIHEYTVTPIAICLSETWLKSIPDPSIFKLQGYQKPLSVAKVNKASGVVVYIDERFSYKELDIETTIENITIQLSGKRSEKILLCCLYNSPSVHKDNSLNDIDTILTELNNHTEKAIILGDMNFDLLKNTSSNLKYTDVLMSNGYVQLVKKPTREIQECVSLIDHVVVKNFDSNFFESDVLKTGITDHHAIFAKFPITVPNQKPLLRRDFSFIKKENLRASFISDLKKNFDNFIVTSDLNAGMEKFISIINESMDSFIKLRCIKRKRLKPPWYDNHLKNQISKRNRFYKRYQSNRTSANFDASKKCRKKVKYLLSNKKQQYYNQLFSSSLEDKQSFFRNLNNVLGRRYKKSRISCLVIQGEEITDDQRVANSFNQHFLTVGQQALTNINSEKSSIFHRIERTPFSCYLNPTNVVEISTILENLKDNKSTSVDGIPSEVLKASSIVISPPLVKLINFSMQQGKFPDCLKIAKVIPLFKSGDPYDLNNYRPISILTVISKVFERVVHNRIYRFLEKFDLLCESQFGYRCKRSAVNAIASITEMLREKSSKSGTKCVFLDLSKAFDTIDHEILLSKMDRLGMRGNVLNWFRSYLSDRKQFVVVNEAESAIKILNKGVPQGSIVGPVLFIIYMNDLSEFCIQSKPTFFADDTTLLVTSPNKDLLNKIMAKELKVVNNWLATNKLCLNVGKTKCVSFKVKSPPESFSR